MTIRQALKATLVNTSLIEKIPSHYSLQKAEEEGIITKKEADTLAFNVYLIKVKA